ncbi:hypothetical protein [Neobacillus mesonae]|nr:hypothetical protein [Neobacillus mesonae]
MRKKLVTEDTIINIDKDVFKVRAEKLICELFVDYVNGKYGELVIELK